jgi:hypothetical protein
MAKIKITKEEYENLKCVKDKWHKLNRAISDFYEDYDDDGNEIPPKRQGDLCDIGEVAARHLGYL